MSLLCLHCLGRYLYLSDFHGYLVPEPVLDGRVKLINFIVRQGPLPGAIGQGVGHTLKAYTYLIAAKDIKEFDGCQFFWRDLPDGVDKINVPEAVVDA